MNDNYEPCFYDVSDDWQERWSLIREFTTRWHGIQFRDRKELLLLVEQKEEELGFNIPPSVREYIMFSADANGIVNNQIIKAIRDDYTVKHLNRLSAVSLLRLSEGNCFWGVKKENFTKSDPPVERYSLNSIGQRNDDYYLYSSSIKEDGFDLGGRESSSITSFVLNHMTYSLKGNGGYNVSVNLTSDFIDEMDNSFTSKATFDNIIIYEMQNIIAFISTKNNKSRLSVELWKPLPKNRIPAILFDYINNGGCFWGIFAARLSLRK